jgi:phage terminase large subunit
MAGLLRSNFTVDELVFYQRNPVAFIENVIFAPKSAKDGIEYFLSDQQKLVLNALVSKPRIRVTCRSGKGIGKTGIESLASIWFTFVFPESKVIVTAPSSKTLLTNSFPEIRKWISGSYLDGSYEITATKIYLKECKSQGTFIEARTASKDNPEAIQGIHANNLLLIGDEASRIPDPILRNLTGTMTQENNKILLMGNPTRTSGMFYDSHINDRRNQWVKFKFSAEDSPFTSKEQIQDVIDSWGREHNIFKIDVSGDFPSEDEESFIGLSAVQAAMDRSPEDVEYSNEVVIGCDVARYGVDKTVLMWRYGNVVYEPVFRGKTSVPEVVQMVKDLVAKIRRTTEFSGRIRVNIDDSGLGGGVTDYLKLDRELNIEVMPCNFGGAGNDKYHNEASIMWGNARDMMDKICMVGEHDDGVKNLQAIRALKEELSARRATYDNKIMIEPKKIFKAEFGRSPDFADAFVLLFSQKRSDRMVLKNFDSVDSRMIVNNIQYASSYKPIGSVFYSSDRLISFISALWGSGELIIRSEDVTDVNVSAMASHIINTCPGGYWKVIGNERCFSDKTSDDVRGQMKRYGVRLRENDRYDELGAIELLNELITSGRLKMLSRCHNAISQFDGWKMSETKHSLETNFGLCYAVLNIVSELRKEIKQPTFERPVVSYNRDRGGEAIDDFHLTLADIHNRSMM